MIGGKRRNQYESNPGNDWTVPASRRFCQQVSVCTTTLNTQCYASWREGSSVLGTDTPTGERGDAPTPKFCTKCGAELRDRTVRNYCPECGFEF